MGKATKALKAFIEALPDDKLNALPQQSKSNYVSDDNFRLDMQGMTSDKPPKHNLQVQINNQTTISTLKKSAPATVAHYNASSTDKAAAIRAGLIAGMKI